MGANRPMGFLGPHHKPPGGTLLKRSLPAEGGAGWISFCQSCHPLIPKVLPQCPSHTAQSHHFWDSELLLYCEHPQERDGNFLQNIPEQIKAGLYPGKATSGLTIAI